MLMTSQAIDNCRNAMVSKNCSMKAKSAVYKFIRYNKREDQHTLLAHKMDRPEQIILFEEW